tara:strand:+ start:423 stop:908 length:486 start_codon:yes stop_codon:yes gene_type:complete
MWKQIIDFPDYEVSTEGEVRKTDYRNSKIPLLLKNILHKTTGRYVVNLYKNQKIKQCPVHQLVANTFIPKIDGKTEIDHIDRNRINNNVSNLRWATRSENSLNRSYFSRKDNKELHHIYYTSSGTYQVQIRILSKNICNQFFKTKEEAILYRNEFIKNNPK